MKKFQLLKAKHLSFLLVVGVGAVAASACSSRLDTRGNLLDPERVEEIKPGEQSREEVAEILGSPSSVTTFGDDTWYYIAKQTETFSFFPPKVTESQILVIKFSKDGKVTKVEKMGLEQAREINQVERKTPTHGNKMTVLEQLVGNLGRFRKNQGKKSVENPENQPY